MALPTLQKTWFYNINNKRAGGSHSTWHRTLMFDIKNALTNNSPLVPWRDASGSPAAPAGIWTVDHSCTGNVAGVAGDGVDRWGTFGDIAWDRPGDPHSWVVYNTGMNGGLGQLMLDMDNNDVSSINTRADSIQARISWVGDFGTGGAAGTILNRPVSAFEGINEITQGDVAGSWAGNSSSGSPPAIGWHMLMSGDGAELRIFFHVDGVCFAAWIIGEVADPPLSATPHYWVGSIWSGLLSSSREIFSMGSLGWDWFYSGSSGAGESKIITGTGNRVQPCFISPFRGVGFFSPFSIGSIDGSADETNREQIFGEITLWDFDSAGNRGPKGRIKDLWIAKDNRLIGDTYPADGSRQFHQIGKSLVCPWGGTQPENGS